MQLITAGVIIAIWVAWFVYWLASARSAQRSKRTESVLSRLFHLALLLVGGVFTLFPPHVGPLPDTIIPNRTLALLLGVVVLLCGLGFTVWARINLGQNWSGRIGMKENQQLIRTGPYAIVRHPIYAGLIIGALGSILAFDVVGGIITLCFVIVAYYRKSRIEEHWMIPQFGQDYLRYQREVKALIPFVF